MAWMETAERAIPSGRWLLGGWLLASSLVAQESLELYEAAREGELARLVELVEAGAVVETSNRWGVTPLLLAAEHGHLEVVRYLLAQGADPQATNTFFDVTALGVALGQGRQDIARLLLEHGAEGWDQALEVAVREGSVELARAAVQRGPVRSSLLQELQQRAAGHPRLEAVLATARSRPDPPSWTPDGDELASFVGSYEGRLSALEVEVVTNAGGLAILLEEKRYAIRPREENRFLSDSGELEVVFWGRAGTIEGLRLRRGDAPVEQLRRSVAEIVAPSAEARRSAAAEAVEPTVHWPSFRGRNAGGVGDGQDVPTRWDLATGENVLWRVDVPGLGNSSPVVWGDRLFVTTTVADGEVAGIETGLTGSGREVEEALDHSWRVLAFDKRRGRKLWETEVAKRPPLTRRHFKATQANSTPATDGRSVAVVFPTAGLAVLEMDGRLRWHQELGGLAVGSFTDPTMQWGFASSPVIYGSRVLLQVDVHEGPYVAAWALDDGRLLWRRERQVAPSWSTPTLLEGPAGDELITNGSIIRAYDPANGDELWSLGPNSEMVIATPVVGDGVVYVSAGYPPVKPIYAVDAGTRGDYVVEPGSRQAPLVWSQPRGGAYLPTPLLYRGLLYIVHHNARLVAYEAETGRAVAKARFSRGGTFTASPVAVNGKIYAGTEEGLVYVIAAGTELSELAVMETGEPLMATPAVSEGVLFLRTPSRLIAVGKTRAAAAATAAD